MAEPADGPRPHLRRRLWPPRSWLKARTLAGLQLVFETNRPLARRLVVVRAITDAPDPARVVSDLAALLRR